MDVKDIKALINEVSSSDIYELRYEENGTKIQLSKGAIESDKNKGTVAATVEQQGQQPDNLEKTNEEPDNNGGERKKRYRKCCNCTSCGNRISWPFGK
ncbi:MAG: hypothetical protein ACLT2Z_01555 [Eubacterium sp.]